MKNSSCHEVVEGSSLTPAVRVLQTANFKEIVMTLSDISKNYLDSQIVFFYWKLAFSTHLAFSYRIFSFCIDFEQLDFFTSYRKHENWLNISFQPLYAHV